MKLNINNNLRLPDIPFKDNLVCLTIYNNNLSYKILVYLILNEFFVAMLWYKIKLLIYCIVFVFINILVGLQFKLFMAKYKNCFKTFYLNQNCSGLNTFLYNRTLKIQIEGGGVFVVTLWNLRKLKCNSNQHSNGTYVCVYLWNYVNLFLETSKSLINLTFIGDVLLAHKAFEK